MKARCRLQSSRYIAAVLFLLAILAGVLGCFRVQIDPVAMLASSVISGPAPLAIAFDLSYCTHPGSRPLSYALDFGDDEDLATGTEFGIIVHHTYEVEGAYVAVLTVTDDTGRQASDSLTITVGPGGPPIGTAVGMAAPDFTAHTTGGGEFTLSDTRGQLVLLDFWGAWCSPCRRSLPHLAELLSTYADDGLAVVLVSTDSVEQDSIAYLARNGYTGFISVWEPGGKYTRIAGLYGVLSGGAVGIPHTFVLDRQGVIRWRGHPLDMPPDLIESLL